MKMKGKFPIPPNFKLTTFKMIETNFTTSSRHTYTAEMNVSQQKMISE